MENKFEVEGICNGNECLMLIRGNINEDADFPIFEKNYIGKYIMDLEGVTFINSAGIKEWVLWIGTLIVPELVVVFRKCPSFIVNQMSILKGFLPEGVTVESFDTPYECESCGSSTDVRYFRSEHYEYATAGSSLKLTHPKSPECSQCGGEMSLAVLEEKYFYFLNNS